MNESLARESEKLVRSWMRHKAAWLEGYLVAGVEDPRINVQSILSRQFLIRALTGERFGALMDHEFRFAAALNWLADLAGRVGEPEGLAAVLHALRQTADNAEGLEIPRFLVHTFGALPARMGELEVPNYVESFLSGTSFVNGRAELPEASVGTFEPLWRAVLVPAQPGIESRGESPGAATERNGQAVDRPSELLADPQRRPPEAQPLSVLEPACGSANDFRFLHSYGVARRLDYTGLDLCARNIENARARFPGVRFEVGNVFELGAPDRAFDCCIVQDLFEHLSLEGLQAAVREVCRVTRRGMCIGFFQMEEIRDHVVRPVDEYHWNLLSMARMTELFASHGFQGQVLHIGTFLRDQTGCHYTHNPNAYTFILRRT